VQEVFVKLIEKQPKFSCEEQQKAWLYKVTSNKCKNILKSSRYKKEVPIIEEISEIAMPSAPEKADDIVDYVLELEEKYRAPIHLYYYEDYSIKEIAKILRLNPSTVSTHLDRARFKLKEMMSEAP